PLLGAVVPLPQSDGLVFTSRLSLRSHPWLADHVVGGATVVPATGLVELALRAGDEAGTARLDELTVETPLVLPEEGGLRVQVAVGGPDDTGARTVDIYAAGGEDTAPDAWTRHATGRLTPAPPTPVEASADLTLWPPTGARPADADELYADLLRLGHPFGPAFRGVTALWRRGDEVFAEIALPEEQRAGAERFGIHPALLDAAVQSGLRHAATADPDGTGQRLWQPAAWQGLTLHATGATTLRVRLAPSGSGRLSLEATDQAGGLVVTLDALGFLPVSADQLTAATGDGGRSLFRVEWTELPAASAETQQVPQWVPLFHADEVEILAGAATGPLVAVVEAVTPHGTADDALAQTTRMLSV
ncbi:polyketide synthase dehydratase domain-containing protein, partial [Streptomyces tricolor]